MTVSYQYDVASSASGGFIRLLFRWRGSVWKVVYREMLIFTVCYVTLTLLYNFALTESQQRIFERIVYFCSTFMDLIPLSFMLGFYVSFIAARWWSQFIAIPWPDKLMNIVAMYIPGFDESSRVVRRTLMRYLNLSLVLVLRSISMAVKRRFPTKEHLIEAGFMTKTELEMFQSVPSTEFNTFWIPCTWFINVLREARQECRITDSNGLKLIMEELNEFRSKCGLLWGYDWISIPLVYTQVVTMATYAFFVACMFGRQNVNIVGGKGSSPEVHRYDYYVPIFTILQLMFYMGLLKVAEQLINPFGDDDEDFELNWIIDRHMKVSYLGVDTLNGTPPPLVKDTYYDELDVKIPYTEASKSYKKKTYRGSVAYMQVPMEQQGMVLPDMSEEEDDGETASETMGPRRPSMYSLFHNRSKGVSPASSYTNLDNRSIASLDVEMKGSLPNLSTAGDKIASGTLGYQVPSFTVDMAKAEDDEIILQEVVIESNDVKRPVVKRSDSLQVPGTSKHVAEVKEPSTTFGIGRGPSPKIAPKFPREKLKSMFRKRKLSAVLPFHKLNKVRFSRDTKDDGEEPVNQSLLDMSDQEQIEVDITLSTPELTEAEKETGIHPYYFTQQTMSVKQLATGHAFSVRQPRLSRYGSEEDKKTKYPDFRSQMTQSSSLPNIPYSDYAQYIHDPIITRSLKKISEVMKNKEKAKKKRKRKSPPPKQDQDSYPSDFEAQSSDNEESTSRRNTLPQIMLTKCGKKTPEHLDLATSAAQSSGHSNGRSSDSGTLGGPTQDEATAQKGKKSPRTAETSTPEISVSAEKSVQSSAPESHSISGKPRKSSPQRCKPSSDEARPTIAYTPRTYLPKRRSPPPPRPESLTFTYKPKPSKKIAGISLKSTPSSPTSESVPSSPTSAIPSTSKVGRTSFPKTPTKTQSGSPKHSPTTETSKQFPKDQMDTKKSGSREDLQSTSDQQSNKSGQPDVPQRHIPRANAKSKK